MKSMARVRIEKLVQHAVLFPSGTLHVKSGVHLCVEMGHVPGQQVLVEAEHTIAADGTVSAPSVGLPRYYSGPWSEAECAAHIGDYIGWRRESRANWLKGDALWADRVAHSTVVFAFEYESDDWRL